ncbi:hypothetical protein C8J57DRAFT_1037050, partial [Mycena rebaudengoi]
NSLSPSHFTLLTTPLASRSSSPAPSPITTMAAVSMPARGDRNAPQFDAQKPRELQRYFTDLEFHFGRAAVTDDTEKKRHATRFLSVDDQDLWESLAEFQPNKSYAEFKAAVLKLYPGTDANRRFSLGDLDALVGEYARLGILSKGDYCEFYRQFLFITQYLIGKNRLSAAEQSRSFRRAIAPQSLWERVHQRLQIKKPDVHPQDPYDLTDLNEAVEFVLADTSIAPVSTAAAHSSPSSHQTEIKTEPGIAALLESVSGLIKVLTTQQQQQHSHSALPAAQNSQTPRPPGCSYCSELGHFIANCGHVTTDIQAGKCKRDADNCVVLPSGAFVPRRILGVNLRARIEEYHRQNPGQLAAAQLMLGVATQHVPLVQSGTAAATTFQLTEDERVKSLERELFALCTRAQARRAVAAGEPAEQPERLLPPPTPVSKAPAAPLSNPVAPPPHNHAVPATPEHPFANSRDAAYAPPRDRNIGTRPDPPAAAKKSDPAYRTTAPIFDDKIASKVFDRSMDVPVTITQRELLSLSPEVRAQVREATTSRRVTPSPKAANSTPPIQQFNSGSVLPSNESVPELPPDAVVVPDPFETYFNAGQVPEDLVVSMESSAIRSILPVVDNQQQVESIVDGGSQIIAMSEAICHELGLPYDPRIVLKMQSANG